ncbi:HAD family phosphatase [Jannaschia sp. M317]|uniref:HAD family hydrolase n=1 Tax=Jannaschia sp. M317 TaxID=2867011 RepID=UPI0021A40B58|nr:HAD family hydrolase [Jannaschia sp. M317]UWQ18891.1 HAD family hydrolase [Jannaschia sp. M317]
MKAILLGSVGLLADTRNARRHAFARAFRDHGLKFDTDARDALDQAASGSAASPRAVPLESLLDARNHHLGAALAHGPLKPRRGLHQLIAAAAGAAVPLGLVATTPTAWTISVFEHLELAPEVFDTIVTGDNLVASKPAADCYHLAAAMLATAPEDCLVIEDTPSGLAAARQAGMQVIDAWEPGSGRKEPLTGLVQTLEQRAVTQPT